MARQSLIAQIRNSSTTREQIAALRNLRNVIVGHPLQKIALAQDIDGIVSLALSSARSGDKDEQEKRKQALHIIASVALGEQPLPILAMYSLGYQVDLRFWLLYSQRQFYLPSCRIYAHPIIPHSWSLLLCVFCPILQILRRWPHLET